MVKDRASIDGTPDDDDLDIERDLSLMYAPPAHRPGLRAIWQLDARMRRIFTSGGEPTLRLIKLAWWEERVLALADGEAPAEPLLRRLAALARAEADIVADLGRIAGAWRELPPERPWPPACVDAYARSRGRGLIDGFARVVGTASDERLRLAGEAYAIDDLVGLTVDDDERTALRGQTAERRKTLSGLVWPSAMRPIGMIFALAREDAARDRGSTQGSPRRIARMACHRLSGR